VDYEAALLSKVITTGRLEDVVAKGIRPEHFADDSCRELFLYLTDYARRYKDLPSIRMVSDHIDSTDELRGFEIDHIEDNLEALTDKFIVIIKRRMANDAVIELANVLDRGDDERTKDIDLEFLEIARNLATVVPSTKVARFSDMDKRIIEYRRRKAEGKPTGIPFGFPTLDRMTGGLQPHEFVTIAGFSGLGKSTLLGVLAFKAYVQGYTPLYISLEMEASAILRRFDSMAASLDYWQLKLMQLPDEMMADWESTAANARARTHDIPIIDDIRNCTPNHVFAETVRHKPDLVIVDYISLMRSARASGRGSQMWQQVTEITQDLKQNARTLKIPIIAAAQTNRAGSKDGAELENIGHSISVIQDPDIVLGMHATPEMRDENEVELRIRKNRDGPLSEFQCIWNYGDMDFREKTFRDWTIGRKSGGSHG
jgi:replicative DNA helicase